MYFTTYLPTYLLNHLPTYLLIMQIKVGRPYNGEGAATSTALSTPGLAAAFNPLLQPTGAVSLSLPQPTLKPGVIGLGGMTTTAVMQVWYGMVWYDTLYCNRRLDVLDTIVVVVSLCACIY